MINAFDLDEYYKKAWSGETCNDTSIINYINSYQHVILWGASYQGDAIGKKLLELGVKIEKYWDVRCKEIKMLITINIIYYGSTV